MSEQSLSTLRVKPAHYTKSILTSCAPATVSFAQSPFLLPRSVSTGGNSGYLKHPGYNPSSLVIKINILPLQEYIALLLT
jgi:hypothetical protein